MPRIVDLGGRFEALRGVSLIVGEGLCSNIYVIGRNHAVVVDTGIGNPANPVWPQLEELGVKAENVAGVALTHAHHDHAGGAFLILERAEPRVYVHRLDAAHLATPMRGSLVLVEDGDTIETEPWPLEVLWTPGHTRGGICLLARREKLLFSGDTVFPGGYYGRFDGETGDRDALLGSLRRLAGLDVEALLPGHGMPEFRDAGRHIKEAYMNASPAV